MTDGFIGMEEQGYSITLAEIGDGAQGGNHIVPQAFLIKGQFSDSTATGSQASFHFGCGAGLQGIDTDKADEVTREAVLGLEDVVVVPPHEFQGAPGEAENHRFFNIFFGHGLKQVLGGNDAGLGRIIEPAKGRVVAEKIFPLLDNFRGENVGVEVNHSCRFSSSGFG